ncbi:MAG: hypothetical protein JRI22_23515 [Deltaproteobacteria bacterium]|nr:hypothetical protein [Deltaproteobacteria bacterium]
MREDKLLHRRGACLRAGTCPRVARRRAHRQAEEHGERQGNGGRCF